MGRPWCWAVWMSLRTAYPFIHHYASVYLFLQVNAAHAVFFVKPMPHTLTSQRRLNSATKRERTRRVSATALKVWYSFFKVSIIRYFQPQNVNTKPVPREVHHWASNHCSTSSGFTVTFFSVFSLTAACTPDQSPNFHIVRVLPWTPCQAQFVIWLVVTPWIKILQHRYGSVFGKTPCYRGVGKGVRGGRLTPPGSAIFLTLTIQMRKNFLCKVERQLHCMQ